MTLVGDIVAAATAASATDSALSQSALHLNTAKKQIQDLCKSHGSKLKSLMSTELTLRHQGKQALNRGKLDGTMKVPETKNNVGCLGLEIESIGNVYKVLDFIRNIKLLYLYAGCKRLKIDLLNVNEVLPDAIQARRLRRLIFQAKRLYEVVEAFGFGALLLPVFSDKKILCGLTDKDFISLMDLAKELDLVKFLKAAHAWSPFATLEFELGQITREYKLSFDSLQCYFGSMYNKR
ncbi:hypothetical protein V8B55DRAFT_1589198 [Mucor lusitanicus]|uniref:Uncharacterized protein n=2 Tax=Mucor circinelloides f. lusitanicus TaxID=29924 RepID=A0A168J1W0_MUCCL|nr:hypothetical protein FB192DRAFT_1459744 [Mucor lusitanicus]OAD00641.1 hypothetical protein MUCCIDRAFT_114132 [Mucor lusitanicus CBS 277.49]